MRRLLLAAGLATAAPRMHADPPALRFGISQKLLVGVNLSDARAAFVLWSHEILASIGFRLVKRGTSLALWLDEDESGWREVGQATIVLNPGGKPTLAMSHFRVLDTSGAPVRVGVSRMVWRSAETGWPR